MNGIDLQLNCAAGICCNPNNASNAQTQILDNLLASVMFDAESGPESEGVHDLAINTARKRLATRLSTAMHEKGICFMPMSLASEIAKLADHPGRKAE